MKKRKYFFRRVDAQVSILAAAIVLISSLSIFSICYTITNQDMIRSLTDRVDSIYSCVEKYLNKETFLNINTKEDMQKACYKEAKQMLEGMKEATGVMYLYTAKKAEDGSLIYVVDGLNSACPDIRYPGDKIEEEIQLEMEKALSGEVVLPDTIKMTDWGKIFITYLPVHYQGKIVGVVGIEFEADHQFDTYRIIQILTPIVSLLFCFSAIFISSHVFRRISNPHYRDLSNTDKATNLKNRNAFEVDLGNLDARKIGENIALIVADLNHLKKINDTRGHDVGDRYIHLVATILKENATRNMVFYRTGGDEFVAIVADTKEEELEFFLSLVHQKVENKKSESGIDMSVSIGYAFYDGKQDHSLHSTFQRADQAMYEQKRAFYKIVGRNEENDIS